MIVKTPIVICIGSILQFKTVIHQIKIELGKTIKILRKIKGALNQ